jgi:serine/threonine protein phosphatase PrpC
MKIQSAHFSKPGRSKANEDAVLPLVAQSGCSWAAVADGMGGRAGGEVASREAVQKLKSLIQRQPTIDIPFIFTSVQSHLLELGRARPELMQMGTTLSVLRLVDGRGTVGHVGDSRIYHLRGNGLQDRTVDQTEVQQLIQQGVLTRARARSYPRRHILLSVLSPERKYDLHELTFDVKVGDRLLLLTDGVSRAILRQEIRDLSLENSETETFCLALLKAIESRGPEDDYSAVCIDITE